MGFAAVARVTDKQWIACGVRDEINFGLRPGSELRLQTTICHEIRQNNEAVIIDHVPEDPDFRDHHPRHVWLSKLAEIAPAHQGRMEVVSTQQETTFTFSVPLLASSH